MNSSNTIQAKKRKNAYFLNPASSAEIENVSLGLMKAHQLSGFEYAKIRNDGSGYQFFSNPNLIGYNEKKGVPVTAPAPVELISDQFWYLPPRSGKYQEIYREWKEEFGIQSVLNLIVRSSGYYEMFTFVSEEDPSTCASRLLNARLEFETFAHCFRDQANPLLLQADRQRIMYPKELLPNFKGKEGKEDVLRKQHQKIGLLVEQLMAEINRTYRNKDKRVLSKRELQCLHFLILGYTSGEMADTMSLSTRTIEAYLESIRNKLNCSKKSEIITQVLGQRR